MPRRFRGEGKHPARFQNSDQLVPVVVNLEAGVLVVVQAGPAKLTVVDFETERFDQMEPASGVGAQADYVAGIGRNFGIKKNHIKHLGLAYRDRLGRPDG
jgi:hypothetical protein